MAKKIFSKYRYDIALDDGVGAHLVTWVTGLMVFFATLALTVNFTLGNLTQEWVSGLTGSLTVEIKPDEGNGSDAMKAKADKILGMSRQHPSVADARVLTREEVLGLVEPWLGQKMPEDIALPMLIDVKLAKDADAAKLGRDITDLVPDAVIDSHADTLDDVRTLVGTIKMFVMLLTAVVATLAVVAVSGIVRSKLSIHRAEVETLHLIGASDEYIARQFRRHTLNGTLKGALLGVACMLVALMGIGYLTGTMNTAIIPHIRLNFLEWSTLVAIPIVAGSLIAHLTAQVTVMRDLSRLP